MDLTWYDFNIFINFLILKIFNKFINLEKLLNINFIKIIKNNKYKKIAVFKN